MDTLTARLEIAKWLAHPAELGKAPKKIEFVKEFDDPDGIHCGIFRFKAGLLSPWRLIIYSDSGIFSEQEKYDPDHDIEQAQKLINYLKQYWKNTAQNIEERKERQTEAKPFCAFVLKSELCFEPDLFEKNYQNLWGENLNRDTSDEDKAFYSDGQGNSIILAYMPSKVPNNEAETNATYNYYWKEAVAVTSSHKAHLIVTVMGNTTVKRRAMLYSKVLMALCQIDGNIGVYTNGVVYEPKMVLGMKNAVNKNDLPLPLLVWSGIGKAPTGFDGWTNGMKQFGLSEMELFDQPYDFQEIQSYLMLLIDYCINNDVTFHDGETVGLAPGLTLKVEKSKGKNVDIDGETLKLVKVEM